MPTNTTPVIPAFYTSFIIKPPIFKSFKANVPYLSPGHRVCSPRGVTMPAPCGTPRDALSACKRELGLHPRQCYPSSYKGQCDSAEFALKQCLAFAADPRDAKLLYDASRPREVRVAANARLQKKLKDQPCSP